MNFYITGASRGLGKYLAEHFKCFVIGRPIDLVTDIDDVTETGFEEGSVVILNAHATQLEYVERLKDKCRLVVMGSIAAVNHDPDMLAYSKEKQELEKSVQQLALHSKYPMLYLQLTSSGYRDYATVARCIEFWLDNPTVTFIGYNINE
jgi:NAD(P)-dependent dehydrogenase (short-subunit alcohol dehydrogenase family)